MEANNLTISIPKPKDGPRCDKNCEYCISSMSGYMEHDYHLISRNVEKVRTTAKAARVDSVLLTGQGEPTLNFGDLVRMIQFFKDYRTELQTNGRFLRANLKAVRELFGAGLNVVAISVDSLNEIVEFEPLFYKIKEDKMLSRVCVNVTRLLTDKHDPDMRVILNVISRYPVNQVLIRSITKPDVIVESGMRAAEWIDNNVNPDIYKKFYHEFLCMIDEKKSVIRSLMDKTKVYDYDRKFSVVFSDYCIQEQHRPNDLRSLIFREDGHLYTAWDKPSSILF